MTSSSASSTAGNGEVQTCPRAQPGPRMGTVLGGDLGQHAGHDTLGVSQAAVDLQYNTAYLTAMEIQYGPAFTLDRTGTIDDVWDG